MIINSCLFALIRKLCCIISFIKHDREKNYLYCKQTLCLPCLVNGETMTVNDTLCSKTKYTATTPVLSNLRASKD